MNKILKISPFITSNGNQLIRNYAFKSDLKIKWVRPERIDSYKAAKSGDCASFPDIDKDTVLLQYQNCSGLETADENVKCLFTLRYNPGKKTTQVYSKMLVDSVKRHTLDIGSMEVKLAEYTARIRRMQSIMEKYPRNAGMKVRLNELIAKRKKYLTEMRRRDYKRFEWLLEKLDLVYKAYPSSYHMMSRRESLTKLTDIHCENMRNERLAAYRKQLESQQVEFLERKLKNLEFIRKEQLELALPITVKEEEIKEVTKKLKNLKAKRTDD